MVQMAMRFYWSLMACKHSEIFADVLKHFYRTLVYSGLHESNNHTPTIS